MEVERVLGILQSQFQRFGGKITSNCVNCADFRYIKEYLLWYLDILMTLWVVDLRSFDGIIMALQI